MAGSAGKAHVLSLRSERSPETLCREASQKFLFPAVPEFPEIPARIGGWGVLAAPCGSLPQSYIVTLYRFGC